MKKDEGIINTIQTKVPLYKNKIYFKIFKDIIVDLSMNHLKNESYNIGLKLNKINNKKKLNVNNNYENNSLWFIIMKNIFMIKAIKNYEIKQKLLLKNKFNPRQKEEFENEYCYVFYNRKNNEYEISNIVYFYLSNLCKTRLQKLNNVSIKEKMPLTNVIRIYLGLCAKKIGLLKKQRNEDDDNEERAFNKKQFLRGLTLMDDFYKKDKNSKPKKAMKESKFFNTVIKIKHISALKNKLANIYFNSRNKNIKENDRINSENKKEESKKNKNSLDKKEEKKDNYEDDLINEELFNSIKNLNKKNKNSLKILYSSSFTRLFIGEVDIASIKERYISNIDAKKEEKIGKKNKKSNSESYLKLFFHRIMQNGNNKLPLIERNMKNVLTKFKKNQELIEKFKRITLEEEKKNKEETKSYTDRNALLKSSQLGKNKRIKTQYALNININKNNNYSSLSHEKSKKEEITKTPRSKKEITDNNKEEDEIKNKGNKNNNLSFNKIGNKYFFKSNKNLGINEYKRKNGNNNIMKLTIKNIQLNNYNKNYLLTERNNSSNKSTFKNIFEKKIFRNKNNNNNNLHFKTVSLYKNYNGNIDLYGKDKIKNQKTKNFFTKNDFYF